MSPPLVDSWKSKTIKTNKKMRESVKKKPKLNKNKK